MRATNIEICKIIINCLIEDREVKRSNSTFDTFLGITCNMCKKNVCTV